MLYQLSYVGETPKYSPVDLDLVSRRMSLTRATHASPYERSPSAGAERIAYVCLTPATRLTTYPRHMRPRLVLAALATVAMLGLASEASAREVVLQDDEGRTMRFDVRADVDVEWYGYLLRRAAHADEISRVTIRIVEWPELRERCGRGAAGCYTRRAGFRGVMVVPAGQSREIAHTLIHEYGHHVDASRRHGGLDEPNGTPLWWKARGMADLVAVQSVRGGYQVGWNRSIAEIFAEDYAYASIGGPYRIPWLEAPTHTVQQAIRADFGLVPAPVIAASRPALKPVVIVRQGTLAPNAQVAVRFGLLGPNRRVEATGVLSGAGGGGPRTRIEVTCGNDAQTTSITGRTATVDLPRVGPAECGATIVNTGSRNERFRFTVRLTLRR